MASIFPEIPGVHVRRQVSGATLTTMAVGGAVEILAEPENQSTLLALIKELHERQIRWRVLGAGSNSIIPDQGVAGCVIRLGRGFRTVQEYGDSRFEIGGGAALMTVARDLSQLGYSGLEFAGGIPASVGGAVFMNAGAHGSEIVNVLHSVTVVDERGFLNTLKPSELQFAYRRSGIPESSIVVAAEVTLVAGDSIKIAERRTSYLAERKRRQPLTLPSCGSVFQNPEPERSAGWFLEQAKMKGHWCGGAQVSELHANWIVNPKRNASASDVCNLIKECQERVFENFQVKLEREVKIW